MTVLADIRIAGPFACTGGETVLDYAFRLLAAVDLAVLRRRAGAVTTLAYGADYAVTGVGAPTGGTIVLTAPAVAGDVYVAFGARPTQRLTALSPANAFAPAALNGEYDALEVQLQEARRDIGRALLSDPFDPAAFDIGGRRIGGVGAGIEPHDAVTVQQVHDIIDAASGAPGGVAPLNDSGLVPAGHLPADYLTGMDARIPTPLLAEAGYALRATAGGEFELVPAPGWSERADWPATPMAWEVVYRTDQDALFVCLPNGGSKCWVEF